MWSSCCVRMIAKFETVAHTQQTLECMPYTRSGWRGCCSLTGDVNCVCGTLVAAAADSLLVEVLPVVGSTARYMCLQRC